MSNMSLLKLDLIAARAKIDTPAKWTKGTNARDKDRNGVNPRSSLATCYCLQGAIIAVTPFGKGGRYFSAANALNKLTREDFGCFVSMNDSVFTSHDDVMSLLDKAIAACPEPEAVQ